MQNNNLKRIKLQNDKNTKTPLLLYTTTKT